MNILSYHDWNVFDLDGWTEPKLTRVKSGGT